MPHIYEHVNMRVSESQKNIEISRENHIKCYIQKEENDEFI